MDVAVPIRFNGRMKTLTLAVLLALPSLLDPALAQTKLTPKVSGSRVDNCAPIGRTANGELVYSMKCETLPAPPAPPPQAKVEEPPPPPPQETRGGGIFGLSFDRRQPDQ